MSAAAGDPEKGDAIVKSADTAFFTFGRFQPPTLGHKKMILTMYDATATTPADVYVFVSSKTDPKENPLPVGTKVRLLKNMLADRTIRVVNTTEQDCRTVPAIVHKLVGAGYEKIVMFVGEDRVPAFRAVVTHIKDLIVPVEVRDAGKRNARSTNLTGMSGTKMRAAAMAGNKGTFMAGTGLNEATALAVMSNIRNGLTETKKARRTRRTRHSRRN
jgi:hypothetical protein